MNYENNRQIKVFLSQPSDDSVGLNLNLREILLRAGLDVYYTDLFEMTDYEKYRAEVDKSIDSVTCSVHIMGKNYTPKIHKLGLSVSELDYLYALQKKDEQTDFRLFIWYPYEQFENKIDTEQKQFITKVRNSILPNMVFSNQESAVAFVEDLRTIMQVNRTFPKGIKDTELFFIFHELDEQPANEIVDLLKDILKVETLKISQEMNFESYLIEQIHHSQLAVVYFEQMSYWAMNFVPQVWKKYGGASAKTSILLIGDSSVPANENKGFDAPNVVSMVLAKELIPLEIKVRFDQLQLNR